MSSRRLSLGCVLLLCSAGCNQVELFSNQRETQVNEMMAILMREQVSCTKMPGEEQTWTLKVASADFSRAVAILKEKGYPKERFVGIGETFQKSGLVSSPTEERIRFMHALSQELSETISQIDGVLTARVHIVLPNNSPFGDTLEPSSASVFIRHRPGADLTTSLPDISQLVVNSVEGLDYDNVSTVMFAADEVDLAVESSSLGDVSPLPANVLNLSLSPDSVPRFWILVGSLAGVTVVSFGFAGAMAIRARRAVGMATAGGVAA